MFSLIKKVLILFLASTANSLKCISLKSQECKVREVVNNKYMSFPYKTKVNRCIGSCNNISNPLEPLRGGSLLFTTKFPEIPGTHFTDLGRMKG